MSPEQRKQENRRRNNRATHKRQLLRAAPAFASIGTTNDHPALLAGPSPSRPRLTDEERCERKRASDRRRNRRRANLSMFTYVGGWCPECGRAFVSDNILQRYCTDTCAARHGNRSAKHRRSKRLRGRTIETIGLLSLARRDGFRCHICKRQVTRRTWSIDHLIPVSQGGDHTWANVALAHHRCNSLRGAEGAAQLRLIA